MSAQITRADVLTAAHREWWAFTASLDAYVAQETAEVRGAGERADDLVAEFRKREETQDRIRERLTAERDEAREHEAGVAAAVESLAGEYEDIGRYRIPSYEDGETIAADIRAALTSTGAAEALRQRDARVLRQAADKWTQGAWSDSNRFSAWLRERADRIEAEAGGDR